MSFEIIATPRFKKDFKKLGKKYPSLKHEVFNLITVLEIYPEQGISLGNNNFKVRLAIASKGKGKSGGARVITHIAIEKANVFLLTMYDKSERENIDDKEIKDLLDQIIE